MRYKTDESSTDTPIQTFDGQSSLSAKRSSQASLCKDLVGVLRSRPHHLKNLADERQRHFRVEKVRHRIHEDNAWVPPPERLVKRLRMHSHREAWAGSPWIAIVLVLV